jgi:hypothetical protein
MVSKKFLSGIESIAVKILIVWYKLARANGQQIQARMSQKN